MPDKKPSDSDQTQAAASTPTRSDKSALTLMAIGLVLVCLSLFFFFNKKAEPEASDLPSAPVTATAQDPSAPISADTAEGTYEDTHIDVEAALAPRTLGNDDAPVKIHEFASLSCGHCAAFHVNTLPKLKEAYIDTGTVQIIFSEFPLNTQALTGAVIARCLPADQYDAFTGLLFKTQEEWAFADNFQAALKEKAATFGMSPERFDACIRTEEISRTLVTNMQATARQWKVNSTPSFLINNQTVLSGAKPFAEMSVEIEKALSAVQSGIMAPAADAAAPTNGE